MTKEATTPSITGLLLVLTGVFIALLITSNIIAVKLIEVWGYILPAAIILFPITYILGDVFTEVYGLALARRIIWLGFLCNSVAVLGFWLGGLLPAAAFWGTDKVDAYNAVLGYTPRLLLASFAGYLVGELSNAAVLSRLKLATGGRWLWLRTIGSTIIGQGGDSALFILIAFVGTVGDGDLTKMVLTQWAVKVLYEIAATPATYILVAYLKRREGVDAYDQGVSLNPLRFLR
jgi:uncharacterized integral membrane protein (TIGR00697 family)